MEEELELLAEARAGSADAFSRLVLLHQGRVRAYIGRYVRNPDVVDDLAQEVFLSAYRSLDTYKGDARLSLWLIGIARHRAMAHLRDDTRHRAHESGQLKAVLAGWRAERMEQKGDLAVDEREHGALQECLKALPEKSAYLISQFYFKARAAAEIARELGRKESSMRMTLLRIRQGLRGCIERRVSSEPVQP